MIDCNQFNRGLKLALVLAMTSCVSPSIMADHVLAKWEAQQVEFKYRGFTTQYTCRGIESKLRHILKGIGARDDVRIKARCSGGFNVPSEFITVLMAFAMPIVVDETEISAETFQAEWKKIRISNRSPRRIQPGDCELIELLAKNVFLKIGAKNINNKTRCIPKTTSLFSINTSMLLLLPVPEEDVVHTKD